MKQIFYVVKNNGQYLGREFGSYDFMRFDSPFDGYKWKNIQDAECNKNYMEKVLGKCCFMEKIELEYTVTKLIN